MVLAVSGLRKVKTDAAIRALEDGAAVKKDEIRAFIAQGIRAVTTEKAKAATK